MVKKFWRSQLKEANEFVKGTNYIMALAYEAWADADVIIIFEDMDAYEEYKAKHFTSVYSGWITLDFNKEV